MQKSEKSKSLPSSTPGAVPVPQAGDQDQEVKIRVTDKRFWVQEGTDAPARESSSSLKPTYVEELEKGRAEAEKKVEQVLASYREFRDMAEAENRQARERIRNEYEKRVQQAQGEMVEKFIDIFENLERALLHAGKSPDREGLLKGIELIHVQFGGVLAELGLEEVAGTGEPYNPELAEAVAVTEVSEPENDNLILEVVRKGYRLNGKLVRPARVTVGRAREKKNPGRAGREKDKSTKDRKESSTKENDEPRMDTNEHQ